MWRQEKMGTTEDEMSGQCHRSYQHDFDQTLGGSRIQEGLVCSGPWGYEESDTTYIMTKQQKHTYTGVKFAFLNCAFYPMWRVDNLKWANNVRPLWRRFRPLHLPLPQICLTTYKDEWRKHVPRIMEVMDGLPALPAVAILRGWCVIHHPICCCDEL